MTIGWAIVGIGRNSDLFMAPAIQAAPDSRLVAVWSRSQERADAFAQKHGAEAGYTDLGAMLSHEGVDAVYVATPNSLHVEPTVRAAEAGKHVLCEKPLALTVADCETMIAACEQNGVKLGTVYQARHLEGHHQAKQWIVDGQIGEVVLVEAEIGIGAAFAGVPWRAKPEIAGAGALANVGLHAFDLLRFLLGREVEEVSAMTDATAERAIDQVSATLLRFDGGVIGFVNGNQRSSHTRNDFVIYGTAGRIWGANTVRANLQGELRLVNQHEEVVIPTDSSGVFREQIASFNRAIVDDLEPNPSGLDGLRGVQIMLAAQESQSTGERVVIGERGPRA